MMIADLVGSEGEPNDLIVNSCEPSTKFRQASFPLPRLRDNSTRAHRELTEQKKKGMHVSQIILLYNYQAIFCWLSKNLLIDDIN